MESIRNPKMEGTDFWDLRPQTGPCPMGCNQCFYNREGSFYSDPSVPYIPIPSQVGDGLVKANCGHDSNIQREKVIKCARQYKRFFFNTSIPRFDFPGPVVFTANAKEEEPAWAPANTIGGDRVQILPDSEEKNLKNIMFVRLRVSPTNLELVEEAVTEWTIQYIPVVLTFMSYYDQDPPGTVKKGGECFWHPPDLVVDIDTPVNPTMVTMCAYTWKTRHVNTYFCPTREFMIYVLGQMKMFGGRLVTMCGTPDGNYCRDCRNCETYYIQTMKHMAESPDQNSII